METKMQKKKVFYTEIAYVLGLIIMAFAAAFTEKAGFGMSMVVAPAYIIHLKLSQTFAWFSFGVSEYLFQAVLVVITVIAMRKFKWYYLFSFVTAFIYGNLLDGAMAAISALPDNTLILRIIYYIIGTVFCSLAVSLFFNTYLAPEAYELIVKELSQKLGANINNVKTAYDCISVVLGVVLSFCFFGFGVFKGVGIGTVLCALINGRLIGAFSKLLTRLFDFKDKLPLKKHFE